MNCKIFHYLLIILIYFNIYADPLVDLKQLADHPIGSIVTPYGKLIESFIEESYVLSGLSSDNNINDEIFLKSLVSELNLLKAHIKQKIEESPYPLEFQLKMEESFLEAINDQFKQEKLHSLFHLSPSGRDVDSINWERTLRLSLTAKFDFIDFASFLGITLDRNRLKIPGISQYHLKHFPEDYHLPQLQETSKNNYDLQEVWHQRWLEARQQNNSDIAVPELNAAYDYLLACFSLYEELLITPEFQDFLKEKSNKSDLISEVKYILKQQEIVSEPYRLKGVDVSYFTFARTDRLWRILLKIIYDSKSNIESLHSDFHSRQRVFSQFDNMWMFIETLMSNPLKKFFDDGVFLLPYIGELNHNSFIMSLNTPYLYCYDISISYVPFDKMHRDLVDRIIHDYNHTTDILKALAQSFNLDDRHLLDSAFDSLLKLCEQFTIEEYKVFINESVYLHHEPIESTILNDQFMTKVLSAILSKAQPRSSSTIISPEMHVMLLQEWQQIWQKLSQEPVLLEIHH